MTALEVSADDLTRITDGNWCVIPLSKEIHGRYRLSGDQSWRRCGQPECESLVVAHHLTLHLTTNKRCDRQRDLDGDISTDPLVHVFSDGSPLARGFHSGAFVWNTTTGASATGTMSGITNAGTHHAPGRHECERCNEQLHLEGGIRAQVGGDTPSDGCELIATYAMDAQPLWDGEIEGALEGVLICPCQQD